LARVVIEVLQPVATRCATNGLYTLRSSDGGGLKQIMATGQGCRRGDPCIEVSPRGYSADGSLILFNKQERSTHLGNLFVVKPDGTGLRQPSPSKLLTPEGDDDWSPDGSQIAFGASPERSTGTDAGSAVFVVNADGTDLRRITPFSLGAYSVRWSPDGQLIAFSSAEPPQDSQIYVVAPDGTGLLQLTKPVDGVEYFGPEWSPDSTKLAFQSWDQPESEGGHNDLWIVNADGSGLFQLTNAPSIENTLNWGSAPVG
jgi:Tol biopolymer transport system component